MIAVSRLAVVVAFAGAVASVAAAAPATSTAREARSARWVIRILPALEPARSVADDVSNQANGINAAGVVVGTSSRRTGSVTLVRAFIWKNGRTSALPGIGRDTDAAAINDRGQVAGSAVVARQGNASVWHAVLWQNGKMIDLGSLGGPRRSSHAFAINNRGEIVGSSDTRTGHTHAFLWRNWRMIDLGTLGGLDSSASAINEKSQIVGASTIASGSTTDHAALWQNGKVTDLGSLSEEGSEATSINNSGQVVGASGDVFTTPFLWQRGRMRDLGRLVRSEYSTATGINDRGQVIGRTGTEYHMDEDAGGDRHGFVWQNGHVSWLRSLKTHWDSVPLMINSRGQIAGYVNDFLMYTNRTAAVWTPA